MIKLIMDRSEFWHQQRDIFDWCQSQFGLVSLEHEENGRWTYNVMFGNGFFYFRDEKDAALFKLTWNGVTEKIK